MFKARIMNKKIGVNWKEEVIQLDNLKMPVSIY